MSAHSQAETLRLCIVLLSLFIERNNRPLVHVDLRTHPRNPITTALVLQIWRPNCPRLYKATECWRPNGSGL